MARLKKLGVCATGLLIALLTLIPFHGSQGELEKRAYYATGQLWVQIPAGVDDDGDPTPARTAGICTIWNLAKVDGGYAAVTASHCVTKKAAMFEVSYNDPQTEEKQVETLFGEGTTLSWKKPDDLVPAYPVYVGNDNDIDDVAVFYVPTTRDLPILPLANSDKVAIGDAVLNVSIPGGSTDKSVFQGYVSQSRIISTIPFLNTLLHAVIVGTGPGSSGSAVLSVRQRGVIGVLVRGGGGEGVALVPSNVLRHFIADHQVRPLTFK